MNKKTHGSPLAKDKSLKGAKQALGTLNTIIGMIESGHYCPEILQQADSVIGLLRTLKKDLLNGHFESCLLEQIKTDREAAVSELKKIYNLSN